MKEHQQRRNDSFATVFYGIALLLLLTYLSLVSLPRFDISPLLRTLLLLLTCLSAYLGARLPRAGERFDRELTRRRVRRVLWLCFALYLHLILLFTLFDPGMGRNFFAFLHTTEADRAYYMQWYVNLKPFETIRTIYINGFRNGYITESYLLLNLAGNLCAFAPFAFFLPYFFPKLNRLRLLLPTILIIVLVVELCQLALMCGSCDIDDVFLNVTGAALVGVLLKIPAVKKLTGWVVCE